MSYLPPSSSPSHAPEPLESRWLQRLVKSFFTSSRIIETRELKGHLHSVYLVELSNGVELTLKMNTRRPTSLMRRERCALETEAKIIGFLSTRGFPFAPRLLRFQPQNGEGRNASYLLRRSLRGTPLSELKPTFLTDEDRKEIDRQLGSAVKLIADNIAHSFGTAEAVSAGHGGGSWKHAFMLLLDSLLFEAENKLITLPHMEIRQQTVRLMRALDDVLKPRLVILDVAKPSHIIIDPSTKRISGFTDFGNAMWGDVLLSDAFENPSPAFLQGYGFDPTKEHSARIRMLLYSCYRCVCRIMKQYYRDRDDEAELAARRQLTETLALMATSTC
ncbi:hypothetical protein VTO42DRAFT_3554 [Malbranchea cinnamomea]